MICLQLKLCPIVKPTTTILELFISLLSLISYPFFISILKTPITRVIKILILKGGGLS